MVVIVAEGTRLLDGAFGAGDNILLFDGLNPEARRVVSEVGNQRNKGATGIDSAPTFRDFAIEMRDHRDEHVCRVGAPELFEEAHHRSVEDADRKLKDLQELRAAEGPAILQHDVALLLDTDAGQLAKNVEPIRSI